MIAHKTKTQKLIKVGNSYAVTLDSEFVTHTKLQEKGYVTLQYNFDDETMAISVNEPPTVQYSAEPKLSQSDKRKNLAETLSPEYKKWLDNFMKENKEALNKLAHL